MYVDARIKNFNPPAGITDAFSSSTCGAILRASMCLRRVDRPGALATVAGLSLVEHRLCMAHVDNPS